MCAENYAYIDKTCFIEQIEKESTKYQFLICPYKFVKMLFLSVIEHYYDICCKNKYVILQLTQN